MRAFLVVVGSVCALLAVALFILFRFGVRYVPKYAFDERKYKKVQLSASVPHYEIRFRSSKIKEEIGRTLLPLKEVDIEELIELSLQVTGERLFFDICTFRGRCESGSEGVWKQHDVDWLFERGNANCIGYAYTFAAVFNELRQCCEKFRGAMVRIIYESPVEVLWGLHRMTHTWNEISYVEDGKTVVRHIDATDDYFHYFLPSEVTPWAQGE